MHEDKTAVMQAVLRGSKAPTGAQLQRFQVFLEQRYGRPAQVTFQEEPALTGGLILEAGDDVYDWSLEGRLRQFREQLDQLKPQSEKIIPLMKEAVENWTPEVLAQETGEVLTVGDEIATVRGLPHAAYGEILLFSSGVKGMVQDLKRDEIGCVLFGELFFEEHRVNCSVEEVAVCSDDAEVTRVCVYGTKPCEAIENQFTISANNPLEAGNDHDCGRGAGA